MFIVSIICSEQQKHTYFILKHPSRTIPLHHSTNHSPFYLRLVKINVNAHWTTQTKTQGEAPSSGPNQPPYFLFAAGWRPPTKRKKWHISTCLNGSLDVLSHWIFEACSSIEICSTNLKIAEGIFSSSWWTWRPSYQLFRVNPLSYFPNFGFV